MKISVDFRPFVLYQIIYVYDNEKVVDCVRVLSDDIVDNVKYLRQKYGVDEIVLHGSKDYLQKYQEMLSVITYHTANIRIEER